MAAKASKRAHEIALMSAKASKREREIAEYEKKNAKEHTTLQRFLLNINVSSCGYLLALHVLALCGIYTALFVCNWSTLAFAGVLAYLSALGITAGIHRLYSHRSYQARLPYRIFMMILTSLANQGTIKHWVRDHRVHHLKCETDADPHNAERGFFFSHMGWLMVKKDPRVLHAGQDLDLSDLDALPEVRFQSYLHPWWNVFWCLGFPALFSKLVLGDSLVAGFLVAGVLRYVYCLHVTWLVNSAAHAWGFRPYEKTQHQGAWPCENALVSLCAIGEGWHNWHHKYPYDYAASELGGSEQYNPTKLFIDACAALGLVSDRKRALRAWGARKERLARDGMEKKKTDEGGEVDARSIRTNPQRCKRLHESTFGLPGFRYRRIVTSNSDSKLTFARVPS